MRYDITVCNTIIRGEAQIRDGVCTEYGIDEAIYVGGEVERYFPAGQFWTLHRDRHKAICEEIEKLWRDRYGEEDIEREAETTAIEMAGAELMEAR